ncbi:hypothetical protein BCR35DRAFT_302402 [Leucosporidium creatinivorum]|uniref:RlpA-like double-psi beta-barrel-protein domain-containing protein-containing protein n=1 Tax=Leucosporidium creatinivorum TaxID=106004 RepID=A0A1Y2FVG6_9BASI|nr:hypothetical protein BCR35DRAFT_302402 [Leucosporidium creatinivorum]
MIWWILGGVIIVILIAAGVGLYLYNKNNSTTTTDSSAQNSTSSDTSASAASLPIATPSATSSSALNATSSGLLASSTASMNDTDSSLNATETATGGISSATGASNLTMSLDDGVMTGSDASDPGTMTDAATSTSWVASLTADSPQSTSISTSNPSETQTTRATYFVSDNGVTPCLSRPNDGDFVVHVSPKFYGDLTTVSSRCGAWVSMWDEATDYTVQATIEGVCANCEDYQLDLSQAAFYGLTTDMDVGEISIQWWWTPDDKKPEASLTSYATGATATATTTHKTAAKTAETADVTIQTVRARVRL